ncbi:hypothetical protein ACO1M7_14190, partial [Staphylococcus aureus]
FFFNQNYLKKVSFYFKINFFFCFFVLGGVGVKIFLFYNNFLLFFVFIVGNSLIFYSISFDF